LHAAAQELEVAAREGEFDRAGKISVSLPDYIARLRELPVSDALVS
jgi:hypothetical protein